MHLVECQCVSRKVLTEDSFFVSPTEDDPRCYVVIRTMGVASFSTSCRPGLLSFPHILKIARMTSTH